MAPKGRKPPRRVAALEKLEFEQFVTLMMINPSFRRAIAAGAERGFAAHGFSITKRQAKALDAIDWIAVAEVYRSFRGEPFELFFS
jgi:hypothetical protein